MSEDNKPKVVAKPPPRILKTAASPSNGVEVNANGGGINGGGINGGGINGGGGGLQSLGGVQGVAHKFRPVSESFARADIEKGQVSQGGQGGPVGFKLPPRMKEGVDQNGNGKVLPSASSTPNLHGDDHPNQQGEMAKPTAPRRGPVSPPLDGEAKPKPAVLKQSSTVSPPQPKSAPLKAKPPSNSPISPPTPHQNGSPAPEPTGPAVLSPVGAVKKAPPRAAPRPTTDESTPSPPPPIAIAAGDSESTSQFAKARAALAADLVAENSISPPPSAPAPRPKPAAPRAELKGEEVSDNAGGTAALSPPPAKPRALKPSATVNQDKADDVAPPQPKPMAKKVVIQAAEPAGEQTSSAAKFGYRKSVVSPPQVADNSFAAKAAHRMSLPPSELNRVATDSPAGVNQVKPSPRPPIPSAQESAASESTPAPKPVIKKISFPPGIQDTEPTDTPNSAKVGFRKSSFPPTQDSEPADTPNSAKVGFRKSSFPPAQDSEPSDTQNSTKPVIKKISFPPGIQDSEPTDTQNSAKVGFRKSSFPPTQDSEQSTPTTQAQKAAFRVSSFHPPTHDSDKIPLFAQPFKPKPMPRKIAPSVESPSSPSEAPTSPAELPKPSPPTETLSNNVDAPSAPLRPKPFALKLQQKEESTPTETEQPPPLQPPRPKPAPRQTPQNKSEDSTSPTPPPISHPVSDNPSQPISPPPRVKPPAYKPSPAATATETEAGSQVGRIKIPAALQAEETSAHIVPEPVAVPAPVQRMVRPVSVAFQPVAVASSPEPPRAKQAPKPKPAAVPHVASVDSGSVSPPVPVSPPVSSPTPLSSDSPSTSVPSAVESNKSVGPPRPPKAAKKPSETALDAEAISTPPTVEPANVHPQEPTDIPPPRPRKVLGSGVSDLASSGGVKKVSPPRQASEENASTDLPEPVAERPPVDPISPPFPARPKRSAPKAPSAASLSEAPSTLPPPPPPLEEPEEVEPIKAEPPKAVWVASELPPPITVDPRPRVRAVFDYEAQAEGQLTFPKGAIMYIVERTNEGYMGCEYNGAIGWVIDSYIEEIGVETTPSNRLTRQTSQLLGIHHQQPVSPRQQTLSPEPSPRQTPVSPKQTPPQRITPQRQQSPPIQEELPPPPPPPPHSAEEGDDDVGSKLDQMAAAGPRLANPKRAGPRKGARPPTRGAAPKIKTRMTTDDAATGPRADLSALASSGAPASGGEDGQIAPRRVIAPGNPSMNIAALAVDQKNRLKTVQQRESVAYSHPTREQQTKEQQAAFRAQFASTGSLPVHSPTKSLEEDDKDKSKEKKSKGLFGILGGKKKKEKS